MRVVLYYDLLRFSPCSIDLFISMNISPPQSTPNTPIKARCAALCSMVCAVKVHYFRSKLHAIEST
jgi:hypothetical protein